MVCHRSGIDDHPALLRDLLTDPRREPPPPVVVVESKTPHVETRRERRLRIFGPSTTLHVKVT